MGQTHKKRGPTLNLLFEVLGNRVVQIQNEAHVKDVSVKLHSLYYFLKGPKFRKARNKDNAFYMFCTGAFRALAVRNGIKV